MVSGGSLEVANALEASSLGGGFADGWYVELLAGVLDVTFGVFCWMVRPAIDGSGRLVVESGGIRRYDSGLESCSVDVRLLSGAATLGE